MAGGSEDELSAEQFRRRLYCLFEKKGVVDHLKTQMRHLLVEELQECVPGGNLLKKRSDSDNSLVLRAANSLVANHLQKCEYEYTMGVFIPESGTYPDKMFSMGDLLQLLNINPSSELYKRLVSQFVHHSPKKGFLWQLLCELCSLYSSATVSTSVQTDKMYSYSLSTLDEKLNGVERIYRSKKEKHQQNAVLGLEEKLASFQKQLQERYEVELQLELTRMKENDLVRFRMEERENCRKELELCKRELEKKYQDRLNALREKEKDFKERLQKEEEIQMRENFNQRQTLLEEMNTLRERDARITRSLEGIQREKSLHEEKMRSEEELLRQKMNEVNRMEKEHQQRLQNEITKFKIEEERRYLERSQNLDRRENELKAAEIRIEEDHEKMHLLKEEIMKKNSIICELELLLDEAQQTEISVVQNNDYLTNKLRKLIDLNELNSVSKEQFENEKMQHTETKQLNECLKTRQEKLMKESLQLNQEMGQVKREMERVRDELHQEKCLYEQCKKQFDDRLQKEITQNQKFLQRCDDQTEEIRALNEELSQVQNKLFIAQKALNNEISKKKRRICSRSLSRYRGRDECNHRHSRISRKTKCICSDDSYDDISSCRSVSFVQRKSQFFQGERLTDEEQTNEDSSNIIAEIKYEKKMLEKQMKNIEHGYKCFQDRLLQGGSLPAKPCPSGEAVYADVMRTPPKTKYLAGGQTDLSPVASKISNSESKSSKTLASTPRKDSNYAIGKRGHSISTLPRFDVSQLTGEDENRSVDEDSPVAAIISEFSKKKEESWKFDELCSPPLKPSHNSLPPKSPPSLTATNMEGPNPPLASQSVLDKLQPLSRHAALSSSFVPVSAPSLATSAFAPISAAPPVTVAARDTSVRQITPVSTRPHSSSIPTVSASLSAPPISIYAELPVSPVGASVMEPLATSVETSASVAMEPLGLSVETSVPVAVEPLALPVRALGTVGASVAPGPLAPSVGACGIVPPKPLVSPFSALATMEPLGPTVKASAPVALGLQAPSVGVCDTFIPKPLVSPVGASDVVEAPPTHPHPSNLPPISTSFPLTVPLLTSSDSLLQGSAPGLTPSILAPSAPLPISPLIRSAPLPASNPPTTIPPHHTAIIPDPQGSSSPRPLGPPAECPTLEPSPIPVEPAPALHPTLPVVSLDDAWGNNRKSESSSYQSKSSKDDKIIEPQTSRKSPLEQNDDDDDDDIHSGFASQSQKLPSLNSSIKEDKKSSVSNLMKDDTSQIESEIESDILPDSGSARSSPAFDLASKKKDPNEKLPSTQEKSEEIESEKEELHSESLSQSHMSDSEVDDMFANW